MISPVELHRILAEWRVRLQRAKEILQPPSWSEKEWRQFSQALALMVRDHGRSWIIDPKVYWDLRWNLQDGGELVCQIEHTPGDKTSLVVAQNGGFAQSVGSYTWLWAEFTMEGNFARDPYWVEGTWKDALTALLLPLDRQSAYLLAGRAETPDSLLLQDGARPNDRNGLALMTGLKESDWVPLTAEAANETAAAPANGVPSDSTSEKNGVSDHEAAIPLVPEVPVEPPSEAVAGPAPEAAVDVPNVDGPPAAPQIQEPAEAKPGDGGSPRIDTPAPFAIRWGMPQKLTWKDSDDLAYALIDAHPDQDPLKLSFPKLHKLVIALEDFGDDPEKSSESILESIQMAWYEEVK
jgi:FeS assembly protein IscX